MPPAALVSTDRVAAGGVRRPHAVHDGGGIVALVGVDPAQERQHLPAAGVCTERTVPAWPATVDGGEPGQVGGAELGHRLAERSAAGRQPEPSTTATSWRSTPVALARAGRRRRRGRTGRRAPRSRTSTVAPVTRAGDPSALPPLTRTVRTAVIALTRWKCDYSAGRGPGPPVPRQGDTNEMRQRRWVKVLGVLLGLTLVAAACGDDDDSTERRQHRVGWRWRRR